MGTDYTTAASVELFAQDPVSVGNGRLSSPPEQRETGLGGLLYSLAGNLDPRIFYLAGTDSKAHERSRSGPDTGRAGAGG